MRTSPPVRQAHGFSLIELMVSIAVVALILAFLTEATTKTQQITQQATRRVETFKETRTAFEAMSRRLGQAALNSYWGYNNPDAPTKWLRQSELHFATTHSDPVLSTPNPSTGHCVFFQAPFGYAGTEASSTGDPRLDYLDGLLNGWGYYVEYNSDLGDRTPFLAGQLSAQPEKKRFRLMECRIPSEDLTVMKPPSGTKDGLPQIALETSESGVHQWFTDSAIRSEYARPIAENVIAVIVSPRIPDGVTVEGDPSQIAPDYTYDSRLYQYQPGHAQAELSRHQLPPVLDLTLIATDESSWLRYEAIEGTGGGALLATEVNSLFKLAADYEADVDQIRQWMIDRKLEPRIFRTTISIRGAKFSTEGDRSP